MFMAVLVTNSVQTIVANQDVTFPMELVSVVHLDGREISVKKVRKKQNKQSNGLFLVKVLHFKVT